jgi:hypothetical protein
LISTPACWLTGLPQVFPDPPEADTDLGKQIIWVRVHQFFKAIKNLIVLFDRQTTLGSKIHFVIAVYPLLVRNLNEFINEASGPSLRAHQIACPLEPFSCK